MIPYWWCFIFFFIGLVLAYLSMFIIGKVIYKEIKNIL